jgi:hypothetical protein
MIRMIDSHRQVYSLRIYEEAVGELTDISLQDEFLLAQIGKVKLALPAYMLDSVKPLLGKRIAILRTDIPNKYYLLRIVPSKESHNSLSVTTEDSGFKVPSALLGTKIAGMNS